jgi:N-acetylglucosamine kinase-like BadF-type ATPase
MKDVHDVGMGGGLLIAVDGGNSKTDLALLRVDGSLLALVRGPLGSPHHIGLGGTVSLLEGLVADACRLAGVTSAGLPVARVAHLMLAGLDFPDEEVRLHDAVAGLGWAHRIVVGNDTFAVLRAGTDAGWGIAVTCGTGINCVGIGPDGRHVRFPSLGSITGDWGGGYDLGVAALGGAARSQDGRGPATSLEHLVPEHFGLGTAADVAAAIHTGAIHDRRLSELARLVFSEADRDELAGQLIARLAAEVVDFVRATMDRLELGDRVPEVLLGGGLMQAADGRLVRATADRLAALGLEVVVRAVSSPPIVGAALLALDEVGADSPAHARVRRELESAAAARLDGRDARSQDGALLERELPEAGVASHG